MLCLAEEEALKFDKRVEIKSEVNQILEKKNEK
jgi:hypothetical protein